MTKQDLEQIRRYMLEKGIKDTELKAANALDGTEIWGAVQEGVSVKISMKDILIFLKPLIEQNDSLFCGFHMSEEDLKGLHPMAKEGSYAWVLTFAYPKYPGEVYTFSQMHGWVATGVEASDKTQVDLSNYIESVEVDEIAKLPDYTASRAIGDGSGNNIEETYIRRDEVIDGTVKGDPGEPGDTWFIVPSTYVVNPSEGKGVVHCKVGRVIGSRYGTYEEGGYWMVSDISDSIVLKTELEKIGYRMSLDLDTSKYPNVKNFLIELYSTDAYTDVMAACPVASVDSLDLSGGGEVIVSKEEPKNVKKGTIWIREPKISATTYTTSIGPRAYSMIVDVTCESYYDVVCSLKYPDGSVIQGGIIPNATGSSGKTRKFIISLPEISISGAANAYTYARFVPYKYSLEEEAFYLLFDRSDTAGSGLSIKTTPTVVAFPKTGAVISVTTTTTLTSANLSVEGGFLTASAESGLVRLTASENTTGRQRVGALIITKDGKRTEVPAIQLA